jgi:hypothetical protein
MRRAFKAGQGGHFTPAFLVVGRFAFVRLGEGKAVRLNPAHGLQGTFSVSTQLPDDAAGQNVRPCNARPSARRMPNF